MLQLNVAGAAEVLQPRLSRYKLNKLLLNLLLHSVPRKPHFRCVCAQPLTVTTASLTMAENLADLIDGYCRLISMETHSFIVRVQKGRKQYIPPLLSCLLWVTNHVTSSYDVQCAPSLLIFEKKKSHLLLTSFSNKDISRIVLLLN